MADGHDHRYSDAANRCSDVVRLAIVGGDVGRWVAIRLADGGSDGQTYETRRDAIRHQLHEKQCAYVMVPPDDMSPKSAETFLNFTRQCYDAGMPIADPDGEIHTPQLTYDSLVRGGIIRDRLHPFGNPRLGA